MSRHGEEEIADDHVPLNIGSASMNCLPDDLLVQILSLLSTKQAASTSILSKRWRTLYTFQDNLDFDDSTFFHPKVDKKSFKEFVYTRLTLALQRGDNIKKLSLKCEGREDKEHINHWICYALEHNISELHLSIYASLQFLFPSKVFTSTTLVKLSLGTFVYIDSFPSGTFLPSLKVLFLDTIWFKDEIFSSVFLVACPSLEDLTIHKCNLETTKVISSKTVKRLSVTFDADWPSVISLDTPSVVDLYYSDYAMHKSPHCNFVSLAKATLDLHFSLDEHLLHHKDMMNLISGISKVKTLHLTSSAIKVISVCCKGGLPMFNNLVDLVCSRNKAREAYSKNKARSSNVLLPLLLEHSPNLKTLVLSGMNFYSYGREFKTNNKLKMLRIMKYQGSAKELNHIGHLLLKMRSLEVLRVYVEDSKKVQQITEELLKLDTASSKVKIQVM